jgi:hypothetical protein
MRFILSIYFMLFVLNLLSQIQVQNNLISTSGNSFNSDAWLIDYSVGEPFTYSFPLGNNYIVDQGFQQPFQENSLITQGVFRNSIDVYPNPFFNKINIQLSDETNVDIVVVDNTGRIVYQTMLCSVLTVLDLNELLPCNYQILFNINDELIGCIPIIKTI